MKNRKFIISSAIFIALLILGLVAALFLSSRPQDVRQQAASCSEDPVNVQFREYTGEEGFWMDGSSLQDLQVGDKIDVNCFSNNGISLLSGGKFTVTLDGVSQSVTSALQTSTEIRALELDDSGDWEFTCSNGSGCSNTDSITIVDDTAAEINCFVYNSSSASCQEVSLSYEACDASYGEYDTLSECNQANIATSGIDEGESDNSDSVCDTVYQSDLNQDCSVTIEDYDIFLEDFRDHYSE